ncbi:ABC transporter ATP-binding protein [Paulownia witches'-broom phytoplasma]|uniref:ABC transporter ATP-binding protein n=1 Tax=Paulownia witches'-broom phytoplasma TaxID=39647 RepID=A0ABX8TRK7_9MOLU|nr:ABC transporter ATP-binding protein [Paulownia witches'-broom phytoplasma]QYC30707.1 ABC transporter ATP-binding protein [Paulownia witches'-broom phytoplasma]GLH60878.1 multidrug ABC transporter ATP-binding protein [Paulownia witches'-broom phytoplasma]
MKIIWKYLFKYKMLLLLNLIAVLFVCCSELGIPFIIGKFIIDYNKNQIDPFALLGLLALCACCGFIGNLILNYCASKVSSLLFQDLSVDIFKKVQTFSPTEMKQLGISSILNYTTLDVFQVMNFISVFFRTAVVSPIMLVVSVVAIFYVASFLLLGILFVAPFLVLTLFIILKKSYILSKQQQKKLDELNVITRENLIGIKSIRAFRQSQYETSRFSKVNHKYSFFSIKLFNFMVSIDPIFYLFLNCSILINVGVGVYYLTQSHPDFTTGKLLSCIDYQFHVLFAILDFLLLFMMFPKTLVSVRRIENVLNITPKIKNVCKPLKPQMPFQILSFENVTFTYPDATQPMLEKINFSMKQGQIVAFVGATGSGKSTLIGLIPRLYDVCEGAIKINDIDIKEYDLNYLRNKISFISQKNVLFKGTIRSNLAFGKQNPQENQMTEALQLAQAYQIVQNKNHKFNEIVSELGTNFSGGQKQRLSMARGFLKKPDIYIFDDSFSALDYKTEYEIRKAFFEMKDQALVLIVAQRLTSVINADKIIVLEEGKMKAIGTHQELMKNCLLYQEIAKSQNLEVVV